MKNNRKTTDEIVHDILCELYENATPKGDFNALLKSGKKQFYLDYEIEMELEKRIINSHLRKYKWLDKNTKDKIRNTVILGLSPKYKIK